MGDGTSINVTPSAFSKHAICRRCSRVKYVRMNCSPLRKVESRIYRGRTGASPIPTALCPSNGLIVLFSFAVPCLGALTPAHLSREYTQRCVYAPGAYDRGASHLAHTLRCSAPRPDPPHSYPMFQSST